jgi:hypothetical protein
MAQGARRNRGIALFCTAIIVFGHNQQDRINIAVTIILIGCGFGVGDPLLPVQNELVEVLSGRKV